MIIVTTSEMQHNFDKYLSLVMSGQEILVTQNGQAVGRFVPQNTTTSYLTDSLLGILKDNSNWDTIRTENVDSKQMGNVQTAEVTDSKEDDYTEYYRSCEFRMDEPIAIAFLQSKGILPETAKRCHIGFDKSWISPTILLKAI